VSKVSKTLDRVLRGNADSNILPTATLGTQLRRSIMGSDARYEIILYWSREDQAVIAEVPELSGCAADGATYQEALANVEVVIKEWIETARELGRSVPEPRGRLMYA
jgi:predicted RNase H-like HicB family nuclease